MKVSVEHLSQIKKKITVNIPAEDVDKEIKDTYRRLQANVAVDGFRKGKVPLAVLKKRFGGDVLDEVSTKLMEESLPEAITSEGLMPIAAPKISIRSIEEEGPFTYDATIEVKPDIDVQGYEGIVLERYADDVADEEIKTVLEDLREKHAQYKDVDRAAGEDDLVFVDLKCFVDGVEAKSLSLTDFPITVGEGRFLPGFPEAIKGMNIGEEKDVQSTIPKNFHDRSVAGKDANFHMTIKLIKEKVLSDINDEFAKDLECSDLEDLRGKIRDNIRESKKTYGRDRQRAEILDQLIRANTFDVPESFLEKQTQYFLKRAEDKKRSGNPDPEDMGLSPEDMRWKYRRLAEVKLKGDLILDAIAEKEGIEVSDEELDCKIAEIAESRGEAKEAIGAEFERQGLKDFVKKHIQDEKVFDFVISKATIKEVSNTDEQPKADEENG